MRSIFSIIITLSLSTTYSQSTGFEDINANNINTRFYSDGSMFTNRQSVGPFYEIGQGSNQHSIFSSRLWIGGLDSLNNLHLAADTYFAKDFYPGPVSNNNHYPTSHNNYNLVWKISKQQVDDFKQWYNCSITPGCIPDPNYSIPNVINNWPAHGDVSNGQNYYIAPFFDYNQDGTYDPINGDYPCVKGDEAIFTVFNDDYSHAGSGGNPMRIELRAMHYAYHSSDSALDNTVFSQFTMVNFSNQTYHDVMIGLFEDMDIGCSEDDYVGCDISRSLAFTYNADSIDNQGCWVGGGGPFSLNPPVQGTVVLKGVKQDPDSIDNPLTNTSNISAAINQNGIPYSGLGCGYGDGIIDNERYGMRRFVYFDRTLPSSIYGSPQNPMEYYNFMNGFWRDGTNFTFGGTGHQNSNGGTTIPTNYCFPKKSDPFDWGTNGVSVPHINWSEEEPGGGVHANAKGDRRILTVMGPFSMHPHESKEFTFAHITARKNNNLIVSENIELLKTYTDEIINFYNCDVPGMYGLCGSPIISNDAIKPVNKQTINIFPNPTNNVLYIKSNQPIESIFLYDITGKNIIKKQTKNNFNQLDISNLRNGIYVLHLVDENHKITVKQVIKN